MPTLLITGANRGIGLELVKRYAADGWQVIACCRDPQAASALQAVPGKVVMEKLEVTDYAAVDRLATAYAGITIDLLLQALGYVVGRHVFRLGQAAALTLGILTGNCNMGLVMVSLADRAVFDMVVFFAMGQLPMYMLPGLLQPVYRRLAARQTGT